MSAKVPKALVFDLDGCLWEPEMYELMYMPGGGSPFTMQLDGDLADKSGTKVKLIGDVREIMHELKTDPKWSHTTIGKFNQKCIIFFNTSTTDLFVAIASKCNEPSWAEECLDKFELPGRLKLRSVFNPNLIEIYYGNKQHHLKAIGSKANIDVKDMIFFDNQMDNCRDVSKIGSTVCYTPDGVTRKAFDTVVTAFPASGQIISS